MEWANAPMELDDPNLSGNRTAFGDHGIGAFQGVSRYAKIFSVPRPPVNMETRHRRGDPDAIPRGLSETDPQEISRDKSNSVFGLCRVFLRCGDRYLGGLHGRLDAGDGRRLVRMPRRSGLREDCRNHTVRQGVPAGGEGISVRLRG